MHPRHASPVPLRAALFGSFALALALAGCQSRSPQTAEPAVRESAPLAYKHAVPFKATTTAPTMNVHLIDVGQGLSVLVEFPCGAILVDTGGDGHHVPALINYLDAFFARRTDLNRTLNAVFITHPHPDHIEGLRKVVENFTVKGYIDDGHATYGNPKWVRTEITSGRRNIKLREIPDEEVAAVPGHGGGTDATIDPLSCATCDPQIHVLAGGRNVRGNWTKTDFENPNNSSLVLRIDFGQASVLLTGDLEDRGMEDLLQRTPARLLDVDIYQVGHHGSHNATTAPFVAAMSPKIALIGVGKWNDGMTPYDQYSTYVYGHPRVVALDLLQAGIPDARPQPVHIHAATGYDKATKHGIFTDYVLRKQIYGTGWDGTVVVSATLDGHYAIKTEK